MNMVPGKLHIVNPFAKIDPKYTVDKFKKVQVVGTCKCFQDDAAIGWLLLVVALLLLLIRGFNNQPLPSVAMAGGSWQ
jgi:hypothetical protein